MCNESRLPSLRGSRLGINMDSSLKTRPCSAELWSLIAPTAAQVLKLRCFWLLSYSYSMKWYSYSYSMPYLRVRVLLTRSTSTKFQGKHRLKLRNMRIAQLPIAQAAVSCSVELLSPIAPHDAQAAASYGCSAVCLTGHGTSWFRSIGDNRSTIPAAALSQQQSFNPQL